MSERVCVCVCVCVCVSEQASVCVCVCVDAKYRNEHTNLIISVMGTVMMQSSRVGISIVANRPEKAGTVPDFP